MSFRNSQSILREFSRCLSLTRFRAILFITLVGTQGSLSTAAAQVAGNSTTATIETPSPEWRGLADRIDQHLNRLNQQDAFSGSVQISIRGRVLIKQGYGWADANRRIKNESKTPYLLASVTKQFVAALITKRVQEGKLNLDTLVSSYVTGAPRSWQSITIRHLLTHSSGLVDYMNGIGAGWEAIRNQSHTPEQILAHIARFPLQFTPGARTSYSNTGYLLLTKILTDSRVSAGLTWAQILESEVFHPAQMSNSGTTTQNSPVDLAKPYNSIGRVTVLSRNPPHPSVLLGAGDLYGSVEDLDRWAETLFRSEQILREDFRPYLMNNQYNGFTFGAITTMFLNRRLIYRTGRLEGYANISAYFRDDNIKIHILSNRHQNDPMYVFWLTQTISRMIFNAGPPNYLPVALSPR